MNINQLNEMVTALALAREELELLEEAKAEFLSTNPDIKRIEAEIMRVKMAKDRARSQLEFVMRENNIDGWRTESGAVSLTKRATAQVDPEYKKHILAQLKSGEEVPGWRLVETESISLKKPKDGKDV